MSLVKRVVRVAAALAIVACSDSTGPDFTSVVEPIARADVSSRVGVSFLAPVVADNGTPSGTFDAELQPRIEICRLTSATGGCDPGQSVTIFSFGTAGRGAVRLDRGGQRYLLDWQTPTDLVLGPGSYRLGVFVGTSLLATVNLWPVGSKTDLAGVGDGYLGLVRGSLVRIPFRIETDVLGAFTITPPSSGAVISGEQTFTVALRNLHDQPMAGRAVTWSSTTAGVAGVTPATSNADANGQATTKATGVAAGKTNIVAAAGGASISAPFTVDAGAPAVTSTIPANGTSVESAAEIRITFNEAVSAPLSAFSLTCGGAAVAFNLSPTAGTATTYVLTTNAVVTGTCTVRVNKDAISDADDNDPPDHMAADFTFTFAVDPAPRLISSSPNNGATNIATNRAIVLTFSEPVIATSDAVLVACPAGTIQPVTITGSGSATVTATPFVPLAAGTTCTVTVQASEIRDVDAIDPPDNMPANATFQFTTDRAPEVQSTVPGQAGTIALNTPITVTFTEGVQAAAAAFELACDGSTVAATVSPSPGTVFAITPTTPLVAGVSCTLTVRAAQVTDVDFADPPDQMVNDFVLSFKTEAPPSVASTVPADGAGGVSPNTSIAITFTEPIVTSPSAFSLVCAGVVRLFTMSPAAGTPTTVVTLVPDAPVNGACTTFITASGVTDVDTIDPPDQMASNFNFTFSIDVAPAVTGTNPAAGAINVPGNAGIAVTFSEAVTTSPGAFVLECPAGAPIAVTVTGTGNSRTVTPNSPMPGGQLCRLTVLATGISDVDTDDPPDNMLANFVTTFTTDAAPIVVATSPTNGQTAVSVTSVITIVFSESVTRTASAFTLSCGGNPQPFTVNAGPNSTYVLDPTGNLPTGATCTVTVVANQISDVDTADPPDNMAANFVFTFVVQ